MALWLARWPGRQEAGGRLGTLRSSLWRELCSSGSEVSAAIARVQAGRPRVCAGLQQPPQSLPTGFEAGCSLGAPQLWWATPWVGLGGVSIDQRAWGQMKLGLQRPQGLMAVLRWGLRDGGWNQKG